MFDETALHCLYLPVVVDVTVVAVVAAVVVDGC